MPMLRAPIAIIRSEDAPPAVRVAMVETPGGPAVVRQTNVAPDLAALIDGRYTGPTLEAAYQLAALFALRLGSEAGAQALRERLKVHPDYFGAIPEDTIDTLAFSPELYV